MSSEGLHNSAEGQAEITHDITLFDSLDKWLEERDDHTEAEILTAIEVAIRSVYSMPEEQWDSAMDEITGIALAYDIEPDVVLGIYTSLEP